MDRYVPLPPLPARISRLNELAYDLWWSWNARGRDVFRDLDYPLWRFTDHNPVLLLHLVEPDRLEYAAADAEFLKLYDAAIAALDVVRSGAGTWSASRGEALEPIAWISRQFAMHQSLPVHATAEGIVSGDSSKEASDLGVPFIGIGLMYGRAYPHQRISSEGWQRDSVEYIDWSDAPIAPAVAADGTPCRVAVRIGQNDVHAAVWQIRAGRTAVYLLDTEVTANAAWDRDLSSRRCADDSESALRQWLLLGAGAVAVLEQLHVEPGRWHLADGYATAVALERMNRMIGGGMSFDDAGAAVRGSTLFSARTDAPAPELGFGVASIERALAGAWPALAPHRDAVLTLGRHATGREETFNGAVLGARVAAVVNVLDVADRAHGSAAASPGSPVGRPRARTPGEGVHLASWMSADMAGLLDRSLGESWRQSHDEEAAWLRLAEIPDEEIWAVRQRLRQYLVDFMRERARHRWLKEEASGGQLVVLGTLLDGASLTIGCAPRFDGSTGHDVLFHDLDRLAAIVSAARHPVQIVFAGRAEAGDDRGKHHLQRVIRHAADAALGGRLAFLEDYDLHVARLMVQGCDAWLSLPSHRGGPSLGAVKAAVNGVPHIGPPAAWFAGAFDGSNGWMIESPHGRDEGVQARALYSLIEEALVPLFYQRDRGNVAPGWARLVRQTLAAALPRFSARHVVKARAEGLSHV